MRAMGSKEVEDFNKAEEDLHGSKVHFERPDSKFLSRSILLTWGTGETIINGSGCMNI